MLRRLFDDIGQLKAGLKSLDEKQDQQLEMLRRLEDKTVRKDEFHLFKRVFFCVLGVFSGLISYVYLKMLGGI